MQRLLIAAALLAAGFYGYSEYLTPGGGIRASSGSGGFSSMAGAPRSVAGGIAGAAGRISK